MVTILLTHNYNKQKRLINVFLYLKGLQVQKAELMIINVFLINP